MDRRSGRGAGAGATGGAGAPPVGELLAARAAPFAPGRALHAALLSGRDALPGLVLVAVIALAAVAAVAAESGLKRATGTSAPVVEALVLAVLLGVVLRNTVGVPATAAPGVALAGKQGLELAVLLLGASVDVLQVLRAGPRLLLLIGSCVALAPLAGRTLGRLLGLSPTLALLVAVGNAICGNSAIAAVAPVVRADKKDFALAVALTAVVGGGLVLGLPALVPLLHPTQYQYGALVGTTVYAVPRVVAAAFPVGAEAGEVATFVKLVRVLALGPVVLACSLIVARQGDAPEGKRASLVPPFVAGFLGLMLLNSSGAFSWLASLAGLPPGAASPAPSRCGSRRGPAGRPCATVGPAGRGRAQEGEG
jgi:uncharacterized integral membrane protein (TIGR00698 family)